MIANYRVLIMALVVGISVSVVNTANAGDADAGKQKSATCTACHGADGNSPLDQFPTIAAQVPGYIAAQLQKFKTGERENPVMAGMVATLSEEDMADLDAYYASQAITERSITPEQEVEALKAENIYRGGIAEHSVPACMGCHGPSGTGIPPSFPRLAGQYPTYIEAQLLAFKTGTRTNNIMQPIAFSLSEEQIKQLALYVSALTE